MRGVRRRNLCLGVVTMLLTSGGDRWSSPLESDVVNEDIIALRRASSGALAAGAVDTLFAEIPGERTETSVTFTTTAGSFLESADRALTVSAARRNTGEKKLVARATFRAPADSATACVRATVKIYYATLEVHVVK